MPTQPGTRPGAGPAFLRAEFGGPRSSCTPWCGTVRRSLAGAHRAVDGAVRVELCQQAVSTGWSICEYEIRAGGIRRSAALAGWSNGHGAGSCLCNVAPWPRGAR